MAQSDVELVRSGFETLSGGDVEDIIPLIHPEFEMATPAALAAEPDTYRGPEGMRRYFESFSDGMDDVRFRADELEDLGDGRVLAEAVLQARGRTTGIEVEQAVVLVWEIRDGKAFRIHIFASTDEARATLRPR